MRVVGRFAGEVPGIELLEGSVEVVGVKGDERRDPPFGVDLGDIEDIGAERIGSLVAAGGARTTEDEAPAAGRNRCLK